jgi:hypothetical protein
MALHFNFLLFTSKWASLTICPIILELILFAKSVLVKQGTFFEACCSIYIFHFNEQGTTSAQANVLYFYRKLTNFLSDYSQHV